MEQERKFGRMYSKDSRDRLFMARPPMATSNIKYKFWYTSPAYDQGDTSQCVAYSGVKLLDSGPVRNLKAEMDFSFADLYKECQQNDEWPGEDYEGTSVRALMKVLRSKGYISRYEWAFDLQTIINHVLTTGPMVVGTWWTNDMFYPDEKSFIRVGGRAVGGHAYLIKGVNTTTVCPDGTIGAFRIINSWGENWGVRGCASISFKDFETLLNAEGEAATIVEVKK